MRKLLSIFAIASLFMVLCLGSAFAYHYPEGMISPFEATTFDNGFNYSMFNQFYTAGTFKDANGHSSNVFDNQFSYQMVNRVYYLTNLKFLGANIGFSGWLPLVYNNISTNIPGANGSQFGIGDIYLEPLMMVWKGDFYNVVLNGGVFFQSGIFKPNDLKATGEGYTTGVFGLGGNVYLDNEKTWNLAAFTRYRINSEQQDTNVTYGDSIGLEAELSKSFAVCRDTLAVGVLGYGHQQVNSDRGSGVLWDSNDRQNLYGIGPVTRYTFADYGVTVGAKGVFELGATNHTEGFMGTLFVSKSF